MVRKTRPVDMVEAPAERYDEMIDLAVRRSPALIRAFVEPLFHDPDFALEARFVVALDGDRILGWGGLAKLAPFPPGWRSLRIAVDAEEEGAGVGSALHATLVDGIDDGIVLRSGVFDDEPRALEVAQHWGFEILQHSISSRLPLPSPVPERALPDDVTVEASTSLEFPDQDAFDAMLDASQTNPERDQFVFDRAMLLDFITDKERRSGCCCGSAGTPPRSPGAPRSATRPTSATPGSTRPSADAGLATW
jgi:GNAT superfamily N-acetyltransferase